MDASEETISICHHIWFLEKNCFFLLLLVSSNGQPGMKVTWNVTQFSYLGIKVC